jgi:hypothetical protein
VDPLLRVLVITLPLTLAMECRDLHSMRIWQVLFLCLEIGDHHCIPLLRVRGTTWALWPLQPPKLQAAMMEVGEVHLHHLPIRNKITLVAAVVE